jgi:hypothetical protein
VTTGAKRAQGTSGRGGGTEGVGGRRPSDRAERTGLRSFSPTRERSMPPPWIRRRGRNTSGLGPDSNSCSLPKRGEEDEKEAEGTVGGRASRRISAAPPAGGPLAAGDH